MQDVIQKLAADRHGLVLIRDLAALGLDPDTCQRLISPLYKVSRGAYCLDEPKTAEREHLLRTVAALGTRCEGLIASHVSAAVIHQLPLHLADLDLVHLSWPGPPRSARAGVVIHHADVEATQVRGLPVTSVARTVIDCARYLPRDGGVAMADYALHEGLATLEELRTVLAQCSGRGIPWARAAVALSDGRSESVGESRTRLICRDAGISVTPQVWLRDAGGRAFARVDLLVDGLPVVIEFDGAGKYKRTDDGPADPAAKHWEEKVRRERIEDEGYIVVNIYWRMLETPQLVIGKIRRAMARAARLAA